MDRTGEWLAKVDGDGATSDGATGDGATRYDDDGNGDG